MKKPGPETGFFIARVRSANFDLGFHFSFHATVHGATVIGGVVGDRAGFAIADSIDAGRLDTFINQSLTHGVGAALGQILVVGVSTDGVGVAFNSGGDRGIGLHELGQALDVLTELGANGVAVKVELHVQLNAYGLHLASGFRCWGRGRCWLSRCNSRTWLEATEVQTQANTGLPLGIAMVRGVQSVNTYLDEEVLAQVVLETYTRHGYGGAVFLAGAGLVQFLV